MSAPAHRLPRARSRSRRGGDRLAFAETLGDDADDIRRLAFYEITKRGVMALFRAPRTIDMDKVTRSSPSRDRLVGYKVSPFLWRTIRYGLSADAQSVALRLICEREGEIRKFVQREYWTDTDLVTRRGTSSRACREGGEKLALENEARRGRTRTRAREAFVVSQVPRRREAESRPAVHHEHAPAEPSRRHKYSGQKTMVIAQQLYEGVEVGEATGLITYMRTDSTRVSAAPSPKCARSSRSSGGGPTCRPRSSCTGRARRRRTPTKRSADIRRAHAVLDQGLSDPTSTRSTSSSGSASWHRR